jgi:hypothetical protein
MTGLIQFYPTPMSRLQHIACFAMILLAKCLDMISGHYFKTLIAFTAVLWPLLWLSMHFCSRRPYISISDQGIEFGELFQVFCVRFYPWSELSGEPELVKRGLVLTIEQTGLRSPTVFIPLATLSKDDRGRVFELAKKHMAESGYKPQENEALRCLQCGSLIGTGDDACSACGWTWTQNQKDTRV